MHPAFLVLLAILGISTLTGGWLCQRKPAEKPVKVMMFVGYFWALTFFQVLLAVGVYLGWHYFLPN